MKNDWIVGLSEGILGGRYFVEKGLEVGNSRTREGNEMCLGWAEQGLPGIRQAQQERSARGLPSLTPSSNEAHCPLALCLHFLHILNLASYPMSSYISTY